MKNIIIVDMQRGFINNHNKCLVKKINNYLQLNKFDIIFTKCVNNSKSPFTNILNWGGVQNHLEQEIVVNVPENSRILIKNTYGISNENIKLLKK